MHDPEETVRRNSRRWHAFAALAAMVLSVLVLALQPRLLTLLGAMGTSGVVGTCAVGLAVLAVGSSGAGLVLLRGERERPAWLVCTVVGSALAMASAALVAWTIASSFFDGLMHY